MSERVELQLPPDSHWVEGDTPKRLSLVNSAGYFEPRIEYYHESFEKYPSPWQPDTADPRIVCSVGAIMWGREVKRLECEHNSVYGEFTRNRSDALADAVGEAARNVMNAEAQEAVWRERAEGSEKGAAE